MTAVVQPSAAPKASPKEAPEPFRLTLKLENDYLQLVDFGLDGVEPLAIDEPPPLGQSQGPNPSRVLGAAVAGCLGASLLYCLRKAHVDVKDLSTTLEGTLERNEKGRLRIDRLKVTLAPTVAESDLARISRCTEVFEQFCLVTQSVREGIDVRVELEPVAG